ncbi:MAG: hydrogen gas-evolving membrane-bound hydrogenase subunit E [Thermomicrobiales bacterium]
MPDALRILMPLLISAVGTGLVTGLGARWPRAAAPLAITTAALAVVATLMMRTDASVNYVWAPQWGLRLNLATDGLAKMYSLLATGVGLLVLIFAAGYIPRHLKHTHSGPERGARFFSLILLFMTAMIGLVMAQDLILIVIFWDLTAITSYYLIGFDHQRSDSRRAALTALLVTIISAIFLIAASALLLNDLGTASAPEILATAQAGRTVTIAGALIAIAALAKSAQAPFHFWLPRAMAAPTPVSAYLHSAAMVAAGVFLLGRMHPLLALSPRLLDALVVVGFSSMAVGGVMALAQPELKRLLAYSTIGQYGYVVVLLGLGEVAAAAVYVLVHALIKSALFLTAGAVTEATGEVRLDHLGGLGRQMPLLAFGGGLAAAGLAALPLTAGFFKDEVFFAGADGRGGIVPFLAVAGAIVTFAYTWRFWSGIFAGPRRATARPIPWLLTAPVVVLGLLVLVFGLVPGIIVYLTREAGSTMAGAPVLLDLQYHLNLHAPNVMALATWTGGLALTTTARFWLPLPRRIALWARHVGPDRAAARLVRGLYLLSRRMHVYEVQTLQQRIGTIFVGAAALVGITIVFAPPWPTFHVGGLPVTDWPLVLFLVLAGLSGVVATRARGRLSLVLALSAVGYSMSAVFSFIGAPDVAIVAVLIETVMTLLLLGVISLLPRDSVQHRTAERERQRRGSWVVGVLAAAFAFIVAWGVLSRPAPDATMAREHLNLAPSAHAADVVTAILADFRGLDTMGEITVIAVALLGTLTLFATRARTERR